MAADQRTVMLSVADASKLMVEVAMALGVPEDDAAIVADHLVDAELRGSVGLSRIFILAETGVEACVPMRIVRDDTNTALVDGGHHLGFVVADFATRLAISKAQASGLAVVGANNHRFSGALAYYVERVARNDLVAMAVATGSFGSVAPYGGRVGRVDTNPIAFGFPTGGEPIVWDIATSAISGSELYRRIATGEPLPDGVAIDESGRVTADAAAARRGALLPWGGHKGSGLALVVRLLGLLCGISPFPDGHEGFAFLIVAVDPSLFLPVDHFRERAVAFADGIRATPPADGFDAVRMPFDRSREERARRRRDGIEVPLAVYERLETIRRGDSAGHD